MVELIVAFFGGFVFCVPAGIIFHSVGWNKAEDKYYDWKYKEIEKSKSNPKAECLCGHAISFHDSKKGCTQTVDWSLVAKRWWLHDTCRCLEYVGPQPLPEFYHPLEIGQ